MRTYGLSEIGQECLQDEHVQLIRKLKKGLYDALMMEHPGSNPTPNEWDKFVKARKYLFSLAGRKNDRT